MPQRTLHSSHTNVSGCVDLGGREEGEDGRQGRMEGRGGRKGKEEGEGRRKKGKAEWRGGKEDGRREHYSTNANLYIYIVDSVWLT